MEASASHDRPGDISKLESKVVLALSRLQKSRYPSRQKNSGGVASKQVVNYLINHYCYLDGDVESQVMTALLSCVRSGMVCALNDGKFRLMGPITKNMASNCLSRASHGPQCTCLKVIHSMRKSVPKTCCINKAKPLRAKAKTKAAKSCQRAQPKRRKLPAKKTVKAQTKVRIQTKRKTKTRRKKNPIRCVGVEVKALAAQKVSTSLPQKNANNKEDQKCKYCFEKHPRPQNPWKKLCPKCHPPGTRYGVPYDKFSPREETMKN